MDRPPLVVAPYDAELFGHWWFEGPRWLDYLVRKIAFDQRTIRLVTLSDYLDRWPENQVATPCPSSWGQNGYNEVWLNGENDWIYRHVHAAADVMEELVGAHPRPTAAVARALNQAGRELLLAEASDWTFMINSGDMREYAAAGIKNHLLRLHRLRDQISSGTVEESELEVLERQDNIFATIPVAEEFGAAPAPMPLAAISAVRVTMPERLNIVIACPELVPFAKTGGLADMTASLAVALEQLGHQVSVVMPAYRVALESGAAAARPGFVSTCPSMEREKTRALWRARSAAISRFTSSKPAATSTGPAFMAPPRATTRTMPAVLPSSRAAFWNCCGICLRRTSCTPTIGRRRSRLRFSRHSRSAIPASRRCARR